MRITQNMLDRNILFSMNRNLERLYGLNEQLSSGQRVNTVSDDVLAAAQVMRLSRENAQLNTYLENSQSVETMLSSATSTLEKTSETIYRIKELGIQAATETYTATERQIMAEGVDGQLDELLSMVNTTVHGRYVFSGEATHTLSYQPVKDVDGEIIGVDYQGAAVNTEVMVGPNTRMDMNLVGPEIYQGDGDLFESVIALRDAMRADDTDEINRLLEEIETSHTDIRVALGRHGERLSELQVLRGSLEKLTDLNEGVISRRQDADVAQVSTEYNSLMALMQMVMKVAAQSVRPSIADFL